MLKELLQRFARKKLSDEENSHSVFVPQNILKDTAQLIASYGTPKEHHEGVAYWAGVPTEKGWVITTVLAPEASTTPGSFKTSAVTNAKVVAKINEFSLQLLAQVHGHPSHWVDHSAGDDKGAFMPYAGFYSVVVPYYGQEGLLPFSKCGVHRYEQNGFIRLSSAEIEQRFIIVPTSLDLRRLKNE